MRRGLKGGNSPARLDFGFGGARVQRGPDAAPSRRRFQVKLASLASADSRALKLETLVIRLFRALEGSRYRLLALSAVTAGLERR